MAEPSPKLLVLTRKDKQAAVEKLIEGASPSGEFYMLLILSTIIVSLGVILDNAAVVIGGMLVAPLMSPIIATAMSVVMADFGLLKQALKVLITSTVIVIVISLLISLLSLQLEVNNEILARQSTSVAYFFVAIAAGIAAAFSFAKPKLSEAIPGIAVTVALLPPLVVSAVGVPLRDFSIVISSFGLFFINVCGIVFACITVFSLMGFYQQRDEAVKELEKELESKEKEASS